MSAHSATNGWILGVALSLQMLVGVAFATLRKNL